MSDTVYLVKTRPSASHEWGIRAFNTKEDAREHAKDIRSRVGKRYQIRIVKARLK